MGGGVLGNIFGPGGFLGGPQGDSEAQRAQAQLLLRMMLREGGLYPQVKNILGDSEANADAAYGAATGDVNDIYPGVQSDIAGFNLPPAALDALNRIRENR